MEKLTEERIDEVVSILQNGGVVAMPTDTIYGLSCLVIEETVNKLVEMKKCEDNKLFILLVGQDFPLEKLVCLDESSKRFIAQNTPNPLTMICKRNPKSDLSSHFQIGTLAIRIPKDRFFQKILKKVGFLISTSCNVHGESCLNDPILIEQEFPQLEAIVIGDKTCSACAKASTIVDLTTDKLKVIRQGDFVIKKDE